jgi:hypothetical protein
MLWDTITNLWLWSGAAAVFVFLFGLLAAYNYRKSAPRDPTPDQQDGWTATGRIDFLDPNSIGNFILQAEDTRIVDSMGGVEHRQIRWRKATLNEAKRVVVAYHEHLRLAISANFVVNSSTSDTMNPDFGNEHQEALIEQGEAANQRAQE